MSSLRNSRYLNVQLSHRATTASMGCLLVCRNEKVPITVLMSLWKQTTTMESIFHNICKLQKKDIKAPSLHPTRHLNMRMVPQRKEGNRFQQVAYQHSQLVGKI